MFEIFTYIGALCVTIAALLGSSWLRRRPWVWVLTYVFLGLAALDSGPGGLPLKILLVGALLVGFLLPTPPDGGLRQFGQLGPGPVLVLCWIAFVSLAQMAWSVASFGEWFSDAVTYLLFVSFVAVMNRLQISIVHADRLLVLSLLFASLAFAITWTSRRGIGVYSETYLLGSKALLAVLLAMTFARGMSRPGWFSGIGWLGISVVPVVAVLMTGTRSGLLLLAVAGAEFLFYFRLRLGPILKVGAFAIMIALGVGLASSQGWLLGEAAPDSYAEGRVSTLLDSLLSGKADDRLASGRLEIVHDAMGKFLDNPVFGLGLGTYKYVDSSVVTLAKFGFLGSAVLLFCVGSLLRQMWVRARRVEDRLAVVGVTAGLIALSVVAAVFEDKGLGLGLGFLLATVNGGLSPPLGGLLGAPGSVKGLSHVQLR